MTTHPYPIQMEIAGHTAMWTRPDTGSCPVSYPAPTYSAVKAIFESILWGPVIEIVPIKAEICNPIQYHSYATNYGGPLRENDKIKTNNNYQQFATVLTDVCYKLYAEVIINRKKDNLPINAINWDKKTTSPGHAYQSIFQRRLKRGQCYAIPTLGLKEFTLSYFGEFRSDTNAESKITITIPSMLRQVFSEGYNSNVSCIYDQNIKIENGVLIYPQSREVLND